MPIIKVYKNDFSDHGFDTWDVVIDDDVYTMSADANMPNGYCQYLGKTQDVTLMSGDRLGTWDKIPVGVCRQIVNIAIVDAIGQAAKHVQSATTDEADEHTYAANEAKTDEGNTE